MTRFEPGDVVLVRFPFTDLAATKRRPALVLSPPDFAESHGDVVALALTSRPQSDDSLRLADWRAAGLPKPTWLKPLIGTLSGRLIVRRLGKLADADGARVTKALSDLIDRRFLAGT
jgi:mRNA interferase MazF